MKEIVIKIPEQVYHLITHGDHSNDTIAECLHNAVENGTPLPKGHGDLIDRNDIELVQENFINQCDYLEAQCDIENAPTIIEADKTLDDMLEELWNDYDTELRKVHDEYKEANK